jgi:hypothetical protein
VSLSAVTKLPHPIQDQRIADRNRRTICEVRGYCGPFINQAFYEKFPDPLWRGTGECVVCCNTCNVELELEKRRRALRAPAIPIAGQPDPEASVGTM